MNADDVQFMAERYKSAGLTVDRRHWTASDWFTFHDVERETLADVARSMNETIGPDWTVKNEREPGRYVQGVLYRPGIVLSVEVRPRDNNCLTWLLWCDDRGGQLLGMVYRELQPRADLAGWAAWCDRWRTVANELAACVAQMTTQHGTEAKRHDR